MSGTLKKSIDPFLHLFWKTQISILRACPPLHGAITRYNEGAANSRMQWVRTLFRLTALTPRSLLCHWRDKRGGRAVLSRVSIPVTTRCTLRCDKCVGHIPDLSAHADFPAHGLAQDIRALLACVDAVYAIVLTGGETFLHPDLDMIIHACAGGGKVGDLIVQTNGTVIPGAKTLAALREANVIVQITRYDPALQPGAEDLKRTLKEAGIRYTHESGTFWRDVGRLGQPQEGSAKRRFGVCVLPLCRNFYAGKLHLCCESSILMEEGYIANCKEDYADVCASDPAAFREQLRRLLKKRSIAACSYCLGNTYMSPKIPVAAQRER